MVRRLTAAAAGSATPAPASRSLLAWCGLALLLWVVNPFAAAFMVPAAHLWLVIAAPGVRLRRALALALVGASLLPFALGGLILAGALGLGPLDAVWAAAAARRGRARRAGRLAVLERRGRLRGAAVVLAWRTRPPPTADAEPRSPSAAR